VRPTAVGGGADTSNREITHGKGGAGGKTVTVVYGLPQNAAFLKELAQDLKKACGTGGAVREDGVELQGDLRDRVREILVARNFVVKG